VGGALAVAALVAATSFVADLGHLVSTPRLYGITWDFSLDAQFSSFPGDEGVKLLTSAPGVSAFSGGQYGNVTVGGRAVAAVGIDALRGHVFPTLLETLGFVRRQVSAVVAWHATTMMVLALVIGIPLGLAAGRWGWTPFARQLGIATETLFPLAAIVITVPAAVVVANLIAAVPARIAARTSPAVVFRSE